MSKPPSEAILARFSKHRFRVLLFIFLPGNLFPLLLRRVREGGFSLADEVTECRRKPGFLQE